MHGAAPAAMDTGRHGDGGRAARAGWHDAAGEEEHRGEVSKSEADGDAASPGWAGAGSAGGCLGSGARLRHLP